MKVTWGTYPDNKGHVTSNGCFRCHDDSHKAKDGSTISADCEYCHTQIETPAPASKKARPFGFLRKGVSVFSGGQSGRQKKPP